MNFDQFLEAPYQRQCDRDAAFEREVEFRANEIRLDFRNVWSLTDFLACVPRDCCECLAAERLVEFLGDHDAPCDGTMIDYDLAVLACATMDQWLDGKGFADHVAERHSCD